MLIKKSQWFVAIIIFLLGFQSTSAQQAGPAVKISPAPAWIKPQPVVFSTAVPKDKIKGGIYYVLFDRQVNVDPSGNESAYLQYAEQIVDSNGLQEAADINIDYDPVYERLYWHSLSIIRDGKHIQKLDPAKFSLLRRERELENSLYNGRLTANIILDDVRVGDLIEYSYSILGQNPVYAGHFYDRVYLEWSVPIAKLHFALHWNKKSPLNYKAFATEKPLEVSKTDVGSIYELHLSHVEAKKANSEAPPWHNPYGRYTFSDFSRWSDVANWAVPLYASVMVVSPEIQQISDDIKAQSDNVEDQVAKALFYVQNNIRYLGVEMGRNSHQPSLAQDTLSRRYGDCKDKAVLLVTLLQALGVKAFPVLVNTESRKEVINYLPAIHVFDHVIVTVTVDDNIYWIDPTRENQKGKIYDLHQPDYGYGLIVNAATDKLTAIAPDKNGSSLILEYFDASNDVNLPVSYKVVAAYRGLDADYTRNNISGGSREEKTQQYLNFYKSFYSDIEAAEGMLSRDDDISGILRTWESYKINNFWGDENKPEYVATFYASIIASMMDKPEELVRNSPYLLKNRDVVEEISIKLDDSEWDINSEKFQEKNKYFSFSFSVEFDKKKNILVLVYSYKTLLNTVPAEDINNYMAARERAMDKMEYAISKSPASASYEAIGWLVGVIVYLLIFVFVIINWYNDKSKFLYLHESKFYPVSLIKFSVLGVVTLGCYQAYWFYRNWSYIKREAGSNILPFWRSIFSIVWIYAFYKRLTAGDETRSHSVLPRMTMAAVAFSAVYIFSNIGFLSDKIVIRFLLGTVLLGVLAYQILKIPQESDAPLKQNSRWLWRHTGLVVICLPLYLLLFSQELKLIPHSEVVAGDGLLSRDVVFMHRNKMFPASEKLIYFYSDALLNVRHSGSGFTQGTVFTYWRDEQDKLVVKTMPINTISKIKVNLAEGAFADHSIEIKGENGDEFVVYVPYIGGNSPSFITKLQSLWQQQRSQANSVKSGDKAASK